MAEREEQPGNRILTCECGNAFDPGRFTPGETFACPACRSANVIPMEEALLQHSTMTVRGSWSGEPASRPATRSRLPPGTRLGHYVIEDELGRGGMGVVYLAQDTRLDRKVALKLVPAELARGEKTAESLRLEARAAARIRHPSVAVIHAIEDEADSLFFVMEYVEGNSLAQEIARRGPLEPGRALELVVGIAGGLRAALAQGVIHRDIKPSNIILDPDDRPRVTDFGLARLGEVGLEGSHQGAVVGTPYYISPEAGTGAEVDHRSDIYSLGVTLFEMLTRHPPFQAANPIEVILCHSNQPVPEMVGVPRPAEYLTRRLLEKQPPRRPQTYDELIREVEAALRDLQTGGGARAVLESRGAAESSRDSILRSQIALARTNVRLGRMDKAASIYRKLTRKGGSVALEASIHLADLLERQGDLEGALALYLDVIKASRRPAETAYALWKVGNYHEQQAAAANEKAVSVYREILENRASPFPRALLEARIRRLEDSIKALREEITSSSVRLEHGQERAGGEGLLRSDPDL